MDWKALMHIGLHQLGLQPDAFWRLTPAELGIMLGVGRGTRPLERQTLDELIKAYPDMMCKKDGNDG